MSLIDDIKNQAKKAGANKGKIVYFKPGVKVRVRFLQEMDEGMKVKFHDSFEAGINVPCQEHFDKLCKYCDDDTLRHRDIYMWSVWDYEAKEVKILMGAVNNFSPIPALVGFYDTYGTLVDRDYVITKNGQQTNQTWSIVPMDKVKFRNEKAKPFSESKTLSILDKAFPMDDEDEEPTKKRKPKKQVDDDEDEDYEPKKKKHKPVEDDDEDDDEPVRKPKKTKPQEDEDDDEDEEPTPPKKKKKAKSLDEMSPRELYDRCIELGIKVKPKQDEEYYIEKIEDFEEEDEDDEDAW